MTTTPPPASRGLVPRESGSGAPRVGVWGSASRGPHPRESGSEAARVGPIVPQPGPGGLAQRQADLVAALVAGGPAPEGFDPARLDATRQALLRKRAGAAAAEWPLLSSSLGAGWTREFARHRDGHEPVGGLRDGWHVARELQSRGELGPRAAAELAVRDAEYRYDGHSAPRRRRFAAARRALAARRTG